MYSDGHRDFIIKFEQTIRELSVAKSNPFYDFSSMAWVGSDDEEALDGFHGSERTYGNLTLRFADDLKIAPYINGAYIERRLAESDSPIQIIPYDE